MDKTVICVYSGTGNTLSLAKRFNGAEILDIIRINEGREELPEDTVRLGIFFPVYMGGVPYPVREFIDKSLSSRDNSSLGYIFALITCGGGGKNAEWIIDRLLQEKGLGLSYALSIKFPDYYMPLVKKLPDEEKTKEILDKAESKIKKAIEDIEKEEIRLPRKPLFGKTIMKFSSRVTPSPVDSKMKTGEKCIGCGFCASICPEGNIEVKEGKADFGEKCLHCYACYNFCPNKAIEYEGREDRIRSLVKAEELKRR